MIEMPNFTSFTNAELFVLSRLAQLRADGYGPWLPTWVVELPLADKPYSLDDDSIGKLLLKLAEAGLLAAGPKDEPSATPEPGQEAREDGEAGRDAADSAEPETEIQFTASDDCMEHLEALRAEVARRSPTLPEDLPSLLLLADANLHPAGFSSDEIMRALESPPAMLSRAEGIERYRGLMDAHWIFAV
ncbi:MAG: hypothetical protein ACO3IB_12795, partial [Phycisphaerales bacterium]